MIFLFYFYNPDLDFKQCIPLKHACLHFDRRTRKTNVVTGCWLGLEIEGLKSRI